MDITKLKQQFGLAGHLDFIEGSGGFPNLHINNDNAKAVVSLYGAQVLSFHPESQQQDLLFVSSKAVYQTGKAIRGGIPVCWPWFGEHFADKNLPNHGFVRNRLWSVLSTQAESDGITTIKLGICSDENTLEIWQHAFELELLISISNCLNLTLTTRNTGEHEFTITQALHSYFLVGEIEQTQLHGLDHIQYLDKLASNSEKTQLGDLVVDEEIDRIYLSKNPELLLIDNALNRQIQLHMQGATNTVEWNPWEQASAKLADLTEDDFHHFICVEAGNISTGVCIQPGDDFSLHYSISV
jgi:glucose-6-phosphate 1-epimerase